AERDRGEDRRVGQRARLAHDARAAVRRGRGARDPPDGNRMSARVAAGSLRAVLRFRDLRRGRHTGSSARRVSQSLRSDVEKNPYFPIAHPADASYCLDRKSTRLNSSHLVISYAVLRDLPSLPTRRSSDLRSAGWQSHVCARCSGKPPRCSPISRSTSRTTHRKQRASRITKFEVRRRKKSVLPYCASRRRVVLSTRQRVADSRTAPAAFFCRRSPRDHMRIGLAYNQKPDTANSAAEPSSTNDAFAEWDDPSTI